MAKPTGATKQEALSAGRDDFRRCEPDNPEAHRRSRVGNRDVAAVSETDANQATAIVAVIAGSQEAGHGVPVAGRVGRLHTRVDSGGRVFYSPRRRLQLLEAGECGVEVINLVQFHPTFAETEGNDAGPLQFV